MTARLELDAIRQAHPLPSVVSGAGVKLRRAGREWKACCPLHSDRSPSFTIYEGGRRFCCFGCGEQGDVFDFVGKFYGVDLRGAVDILTGGHVPAVDVQPLPANDQGDRLDEARSIWRAAQPAAGTLAERYVRARGIDIPLPPTIRFASLRYGRKGREYPCLVAAVTGPDNRLCGVQRTFLAADGRGKAPVPKAKLALGRVSGGAIRLAPAAAELIVCAGLEDGLTLQQELGRAVWAVTGDVMLAALRLPELVRSIAIGGDADEPGHLAAHRAASSFAQRGLETRVFFPVGAKDFNAEIMGVHA
jgi:DNA primase